MSTYNDIESLPQQAAPKFTGSERQKQPRHELGLTELGIRMGNIIDVSVSLLVSFGQQGTACTNAGLRDSRWGFQTS